jgi:hypothetical protein
VKRKKEEERYFILGKGKGKGNNKSISKQKKARWVIGMEWNEKRR